MWRCVDPIFSLTYALVVVLYLVTLETTPHLANTPLPCVFIDLLA
jgi:hypothetical protein